MKLCRCKNTCPQYLAAASAAWFCTGIHLGWPSPSLPKILSDEYPFNVTTEEASYMAVIGPIGDIVGITVWSFLLDLIGRKATILLTGVPQVASMTMIYFSNYSVLLVYVGRFIGGCSEGACFTVLPIYICEILEPRFRGSLGVSFAFSVNLGVLFTNIVGSCLSIYHSALIYLSLSVCFMASFTIMPESPYYLIMKNRLKEAEECLKELRGSNDVSREFSLLTTDVVRQMSEKGCYKDLYKITSNLRATMIMVILVLVQQYSGHAVFLIYTQLLFKEATDTISEQLAAVILLCIQMVTIVFTMSIIDKVGRKPLLLTSLAGALLTLTINAVFFAVRDFTSVDLSSSTVLPLVVLILFGVFDLLGVGSIINLLAGELFPANVKGKAVGLLNILGAVGMLTSTKFYQFTTDHYSLVVPFAVFGGVQLVGFVLCWKLVPETKNKTLEEIQQELKKNEVGKKVQIK